MKRALLGVIIGALFIFAAKSIDVSADLITREQSLGGMSYYLNNFYDNGGKLYDDEELELLANVMYYENYCNGEYIMKLTGSVVLNRAKCKWYPNTIKEVLYQKGQYATVPQFFTKKIPDSVYLYAKELLIGGSICPDNVVFQSMFKQGSGVYYVENHEYFCYW